MRAAPIKDVRKLAREMGRVYFAGPPCVNGHKALRYVSNGHCCECTCLAVAPVAIKRRIRDPLKAREHSKRAARRRRGAPEPLRPMPDNCECCGRHKSQSKKAIHLDHDHTTGKFRGWLCNLCNAGTGMLGDTVESLEQAIAYLKRADV